MKKRKFKITLTPAENSIVIQSLNHLRNTMLRENPVSYTHLTLPTILRV